MKSFLRILAYLLNYRVIVALSILFSFLYAGMNVMSVYLVGPFLEKLFLGGKVITSHGGFFKQMNFVIRGKVDELLGNGTPREVLTRLCLLVMLIIILKNICSYLQGYLMAYVEQGVIRNIRDDLYTAYHRLPLRYFQKQKTGDLISRVVNDCNTINTNLNSTFLNLMKEPASIIIILFVMVIISWKLTLLSFVVAPPTLYIINLIGSKLRRRTKRTQARIADVTSVLEETIAGIRVVKAFAMERFEIGRFNRANESYLRAFIRLERMRRLSPPVTEVFGVGMAIAVLWVGGLLVLEAKWLAPGDFMQFLILMFLLMQSAKRLSEVTVKVQVGVAASHRVFEIIDLPVDIADPGNPVPVGRVYPVEFSHVHYEYDPGVPVLRDINLKVTTGETLAIVGPSGGGKSTLVDLLPRFFDPTAGSVTIGDVDIRNFRLDDLRNLFGIVTQETILFHDTIRANIAYGRPDIPMEDIVTAARAANAHEFIRSFKHGYDMVVGERGTKLSGGQKQRLVIARAILKNPPILIFDEATSALDSKAEAEVQAAIEHLMKGRTTFVIAHRLSTVQSASRIIVIDQGRIVEEGTHEKLYANGKLYRQLYDLQFAGAPLGGVGGEEY